jgi:hypothetical protein
MKIKLFILSVILFICIYSKELISQNLFSIKLNSEEINGNYFNNTLSMEIKNTSSDTILIITEPFECETVGNNKWWFANMVSNKNAPNRIVFFKKPFEGYMDGDGGSNISYLRFPKILSINPKDKTNLLLKFDEEIKNLLKDNNWDIFCEIWFAPKNEIKYALEKKNVDLKEKFENSLFFNDTIQINIVSENLRNHYPMKTYDSSLYFYKDGINYTYSYQSDFDFIISFFKYYVNNTIHE